MKALRRKMSQQPPSSQVNEEKNRKIELAKIKSHDQYQTDSSLLELVVYRNRFLFSFFDSFLW